MVNGEKGNEVTHPLETPLCFDRKGKAFYILDSWGGGLQLQAKMLKAQLSCTQLTVYTTGDALGFFT